METTLVSAPLPQSPPIGGLFVVVATPFRLAEAKQQATDLAWVLPGHKGYEFCRPLDPSEHFSVRRLNQLASALDCRNYLEIGVFEGETFLHVDVASRTGVDPLFRFDWRSQHNSEGVRLYECTSDAFFQDLAPSTRYDLIFIDGLHTFEQTYRDILHALRHSHAGTVIAIDDTIPSDVYSTCRNQQECYELRQNYAASKDRRWHGDTYKIVPLIAAFNNDLSLVTLIDGGNPWTLIWRPPAPEPQDDIRASQAQWAVQNLSAADYLWLHRNLSLYAPVSEAEGLQEVIVSLQGAPGKPLPASP